jgi:hypothetical protein
MEKETKTVWIAKDSRNNNSEVFVFTQKPHWDSVDGFWYRGEFEGEGAAFPKSLFPQIQPRECFEAEIVLKEKISE